MLSRIDIKDGDFRRWVTNTTDSNEVIIGVYETMVGAYEGMQAAIAERNDVPYVLQSFCNCCGKHASSLHVWFDPTEQQLFGSNGE